MSKNKDFGPARPGVSIADVNRANDKFWKGNKDAEIKPTANEPTTADEATYAVLSPIDGEELERGLSRAQAEAAVNKHATRFGGKKPRIIEEKEYVKNNPY